MALIATTVVASDVSDAWRQAAGALLKAPDKKAAHLIVRIADCTGENAGTRSQIDQLVRGCGFQSVETVANTIFPAKVAVRFPEPSELAEHYRTSLLPVVKRLFPAKNAAGTYFGRMVAYPGPGGGTVDQLTHTVKKLRGELAHHGGALSSHYEVAYQAAEDIGDDLAEQLDGSTATTPIAVAAAVEDAVDAGSTALTYSPTAKDDARRMGFPCLSLASFHLDGKTLHLAAHYRNQNMVERGYGNYLGLGRLLTYISAACELIPGELLVVSGHAHLERTRGVLNIVNGQLTLPV